MTHSNHYDALILGAGQAGVPLARALAAGGRRTALVERTHVGGTCINEGCTPTKTMVASARVAYLARRAADYGVRTGPVAVDIAAVRERKRKLVTEGRDPKTRRYRKTEHLDLIFGEGRFTGPRTVEVRLNDGGNDGGDNGGTRTLTAERIFINTGQHPALPPLP